MSPIHQWPPTFDQALLRILALLMFPFLTSTEWAPVPAAQLEEHIHEIPSHAGQLPPLTLPMYKMNLHVALITNFFLGSFTTEFAEFEQNLGALAARILAVEAGHGSASRRWQEFSTED